VGLERLQPLLDASERWDQRLNDDEKQSLAVARIVLQGPKWVVLNATFDLIDPALRRRIEALFVNELAQVGFINIAAEPRDPGFFGRRLRLVMDPQGPTFSPGDLATSMP